MLRRAAVLAVVLAACALATEAQTPPSLIVQRAGPNGEIDSLDQAKEIRIVFSEPMVALGRIPQPVEVPFVRIEPAIRGAFRWSGTTILIFTPDPRQPLPYATPYQVTVDTTARAVSGRPLAATYTFRFTTPTVELLRVDQQRLQGRVDRAVGKALRLGQSERACVFVDACAEESRSADHRRISAKIKVASHVILVCRNAGASQLPSRGTKSPLFPSPPGEGKGGGDGYETDVPFAPHPNPPPKGRG